MQIGIPRVSNSEVQSSLNATLLSDEPRLHQLKLLGHILRRPLRHPSRVACFDRFLQPQVLGGPLLATTVFNDHFFAGAGIQRDIKNKILEVAANRESGACILSQTRNIWRRQREGRCTVGAQGS